MLELVLSPLFVDVSATGDITTRNQQLAQLITGEDKTMHLEQRAITVRLLDSSGSPLQGFSSGSNTYVVGSAGDRYTIQIRNNTGSRFEAVTTVDGLDVINGRTGSLSNRGYIVNGVRTQVTDPGAGTFPQSGVIDVSGHSIAFFMNCTDCIGGAGTARITGFEAAAIPEPGALALLGIGLFGLVHTRRQRT